MLNRTTQIFIGKDINRTAAVTEGAGSDNFTLSSHIVNGEIVVLDKFKRVLPAGSTVSDTDVVYIAQGTSNTYDYVNEPGTSTTSNVRIRISSPIEGMKVKGWTGTAYKAATQQATTFDCTGITPVIGTEYILRVIYKDIWEHPGQYTATYRLVSTTATLSTFLDAMVTKINKHSGRRIIATDTATALTITGISIPQCTTGLNDLDPYSLVEFKGVLDYVSTATVGANPIGSWVTLGATVTNISASYGSGMWETVRDTERTAWSSQGIYNRRLFPVITPAYDTVVGATYDLLTIEHDRSYLSPDNQTLKTEPCTTIIAFVVPSAGTQETTVLGQLNPWMSSVDDAFAPVKFRS